MVNFSSKPKQRQSLKRSSSSCATSSVSHNLSHSSPTNDNQTSSPSSAVSSRFSLNDGSSNFSSSPSPNVINSKSKSGKSLVVQNSIHGSSNNSKVKFSITENESKYSSTESFVPSIFGSVISRFSNENSNKPKSDSNAPTSKLELLSKVNKGPKASIKRHSLKTSGHGITATFSTTGHSSLKHSLANSTPHTNLMATTSAAKFSTNVNGANGSKSASLIGVTLKTNGKSIQSSCSKASFNCSSRASNASFSSSYSAASNKKISLPSKLFLSFEPSSIPGRPKFYDKLREVENCEPFIEVNNEEEMRSKGYMIESFIISDDCYKFYSARKDSRLIICKVIEMDNCSPRYRQNMLQYGLRIARFMGRLKSELQINNHFINIYEIFKLNSTIYMFMEECPNKSLYLILMDREEFSAEDERRWTVQIVKGIGKMQEYGIAHRFLKLQHILFDSKHNVKIAGWSKSVTFWDPVKDTPLFQNKERRSRKNGHFPPEAFRGVYDPSKVDMWSLGVLMVCLQTRCYPFNVNSTSKFSAQWRQFVLKHKMNRYVRAACNKTFFVDPKRRATPINFLDHPYFHAPVSNIKLKVIKTTEDPKYDPYMPEEKFLHFSTSGTDLSTVSKSGYPDSSSISKKLCLCSCVDGSAKSSEDSSANSSFYYNSMAGTITSSIANGCGSKSSYESSVSALSKSGSKVPSYINRSDVSNNKSRNQHQLYGEFEEVGDDNATGMEGGKVGDKISEDEFKYESIEQENLAAEEQADQANPVKYFKSR